MNSASQTPTPRTAITNVRLFNGQALTAPSTLVIEGGRIVTGDAHGARVVDGAGGTLLPGLIDAHVHVFDEESLRQALRCGVTTVLDMASVLARLAPLRHRQGLPDLRSAGIPASAPGGTQTTRMGFPPDSALTGPEQADAFVAARLAEGSDYVKLIVESPARMGSAALGQRTLDALVVAARARGLLSVAHASSVTAARMAIQSGVDVVTHVPMDAVLDAESIEPMAAPGRFLVPTLTMAEAIVSKVGHVSNAGPGLDYAHARDTVTRFHQRGVPILAGTDANSAPGSPMPVAHGEAMHRELELLVGAGLTPVEALRAATVLPARHFRLHDRGTLTPGLRADLLLVEGDPTRDIRATRAIRAVWCAGVGGRVS